MENLYRIHWTVSTVLVFEGRLVCQHKEEKIICESNGEDYGLNACRRPYVGEMSESWIGRLTPFSIQETNREETMTTIFVIHSIDKYADYLADRKRRQIVEYNEQTGENVDEEEYDRIVKAARRE